jgi:spermidine synthase
VDVAAAVHHGARHVDAVEVNPIIVRLVTGPYAERLGGLFTRPEVTLHNAEGRSFVRQSERRYDLIQISLVDTWAAASSGAYSLAESYLYTAEAFEDYLAHLSDEGAFTITRWLTTPPREPLRLCTVAVEALRRRGAERPRRPHRGGRSRHARHARGTARALRRGGAGVAPARRA